MHYRTSIAALFVLLCCTACGGGDPAAPVEAPEPIAWGPGFKMPHHQVFTLGRGQPPTPVMMIALDGTLRLQNIMGGTMILADITTGAQVAVLSAAANGAVTMGDGVLPAGALISLHAAGGQVTWTTITNTIEGKSDKDLQLLLQ